MNEWKIYKLGNLVEITSSKRIMRSEYLSEGIPFFRSKEIIELNHGNSISTELFISSNRYEEIKRKFGVPQNGDMLLTSVGTLGIPYLVQEKDKFYFKDGNLTWFRNFNEKLSNKFLFYWINSPIGKARINKVSIGSTQKALTISSLKSLDIELPPIYQQLKIVNILDSLSQKIQLNTQTNQTLEAIAQAIFKSWFVDFDPVRAKAQAILDGKTNDEANLSAMSVISGKAIEDLSQTEYQELWEIADAFPSELVENTEFGEVPKGWENGTLGDITSSYREKVKNKQAIVLSAVATGELVKSDEYFNKQVYSKSIEKYLQVNPLDFAFNPARVNIGSIGLHKENFLGAVSPVYEVFTTRKNYHWFVSRFIQLEKTKQWIKLLSNGSVRQTLKLSDLQSIPCIIPSNDIVEIFNNYWLLFYEKINSNKENCKKLEKTRDLLLPKLLSGELFNE